MTPELETWLKQATRRLSKDSASQVRTEILEHYQSAREAAITEDAAIAALGSAKIANRQYRQVLLTSAEARLLRDAQWESHVVCGRPSRRKWLKTLFLSMPVVALGAAIAFFLKGEPDTARILLAGSALMALLGSAPFLPIYTPARGRIFRIVKWVALIATFVLAFKEPWLLISCLFPLVWTEWTRISIRGKLPVTQWPKHLYL